MTFVSMEFLVTYVGGKLFDWAIPRGVVTVETRGYS